MSDDVDDLREHAYGIHDRWFAGEPHDSRDAADLAHIEGLLGFSSTRLREIHELAQRGDSAEVRAPHRQQGRTRETVRDQLAFQMRDGRGRFLPPPTRGERQR